MHVDLFFGDIGDTVHFDQGITRHASIGGHRGAHGRLLPETTPEDLVHLLVVTQVCEVYIDLKHMLHRSARLDELLLEFEEYMVGMRFYIAFEMRPFTRNENKSAKGGGAREKRDLLVRHDILADLFI